MDMVKRYKISGYMVPMALLNEEVVLAADFERVEAELAEARKDTLAGCRQVYDEKIGIQAERIAELEEALRLATHPARLPL